jgi:hypothetical protein
VKLWDEPAEFPAPQRFIAILWLSFLVAGVATTLFFAAVDPLHLIDCLALPDIGRLGVYTLGFFLFWLLTAASGLLTSSFLRTPTHPDHG